MTDEEKRLKEIKRLKWLKSEIIKNERKEIKRLTEEEQMVIGYRRLENERRSKNRNKNHH